MLPTQGSMDLIPGWRTEIPQPVRCGQKEKKKKSSDQDFVFFLYEDTNSKQ